MTKYEVIIYWSDEDQGGSVAEVPELPGCSAHGSTQEAALASAQQQFITGSKPPGSLAIGPQPKGRRLILA